MTTISNAHIFDGTQFRTETAISFENGRICEVNNRTDGIDVHGLLLTPGFVDIHMHGQRGFDSMRSQDIPRMACTQVQYGVTSFCPASITETDKATRAYLSDVKQAMVLDHGARVLGAYLEGPYLAESVRGAHDKAKLLAPSIAHYKKLVSGYEHIITRVTLAPEIHGGMELAKYLAEHGIVASIGHSAATAEQATQAIALGVTCSTHTCNGMELLHHRRPGVLGTILTNDSIHAEFIADLVPIDPILIKLIHRVKGAEGCYYCTDSMEAGGMPDGSYHLGNEVITVKNGIALKGNSLAGSTLTMDQGLRNLVQSVGLPLNDALRMGTRNPADILHRTDLGRIAVGTHADFILLDSSLNVQATYVRGICEYSAILNNEMTFSKDSLTKGVLRN